MRLRKEVERQDRVDAVSSGLEEVQVASVPALQERYAMRAGRSCRARAPPTPSRPERGGLTYASRSPPPVSHHSRICGRRWEQAPRRTSARGAFRAASRTASPESSTPSARAPSRSTCAASHRARSRDRARALSARRCAAAARAPRDAARAAVAGRPSGRVPARAYRAIPRSPRPDAIRSARRAGDPQRMKMQPQTFDPGRFEIVERGVERGRRPHAP